MKSIVILGSTGSIGTNTLDIVERFPEEFRIVGLTAGNNDEMLAEQIRRFRPQAVAMSTEAAANKLRHRCSGLSTEILGGQEGLAKQWLCRQNAPDRRVATSSVAHVLLSVRGLPASLQRDARSALATSTVPPNPPNPWPGAGRARRRRA